MNNILQYINKPIDSKLVAKTLFCCIIFVFIILNIVLYNTAVTQNDFIELKLCIIGELLIFLYGLLKLYL